MTTGMKMTLLLCGLCVMGVASAQDEASTALADCQAHQQRLEELESSYTPPPPASGWVSPGMQAQQFGENDLQHERALVDRACNYAKALRVKEPAATKTRAIDRPAAFRSDELRAPPPMQRAPQPATPAPQPMTQQRITPQENTPPPRRVMRRDPPPAQPSVGGTRARHDDSSQPSPQR